MWVNLRCRSGSIPAGSLTDLAEAVLAACTQEVPDAFNYGLNNRKIVYHAYPGCYPPTPAVDWEHYNGEPIQVNGRALVLKDKPELHDLVVGAVVVATGFDPYEPRRGEYGYEEIPEVTTLPKFIRHLAMNQGAGALTWNGHPVRHIGLVHCVGSREMDGIDEPHEDGQVNAYCSRVCCTATLHLAAELHEKFPEIKILDFL